MNLFQIALAVATILGGLAAIGFLAEKWREHSLGVFWRRIRLLLGGKSLPQRLLLFVWSYPEGKGNQASWAVKESEVLRGRIQSAREKPGLGTAIVSTELALDLFGAKANERVETCLSWAIARADKTPPHLLPGVLLNDITSCETQKPDFRHTLALAVILARSRRFYGYLEGYLGEVLASQRKDRGWDPGSGATSSEVFTVFYAVELLHLCTKDLHFLPSKRRECEVARDRGLEWLVANRTATGLWVSGVLTEFTWDDLFTTAWVIHRLCPLPHTGVKEWPPCVERALTILMERSLNPDSWAGTDPNQRNRVEARIGAAATKAIAHLRFQQRTSELVERYLDQWRKQARDWATNLPEGELDLATTTFLLEGLYTREDLVKHARRISG
jgi:hypothetical protein